jgi:Holliday junction DNA helicase RuvA
LDLYGFKSVEEMDFFQQLISVSGVGPKSALNILGLAKLDDLKMAITSGDPTILQQVSGIGKKTAERLVVELKEKIITDISDNFTFNSEGNQVVEALTSLGYKEKDVKELVKDLKLEGDLATMVRSALQAMNK